MPKIVRVPTIYKNQLNGLRESNDINESAPLVTAIAPFEIPGYEFPGYLEFDDGESLVDLNGLEPVAVAGSVMAGVLMGALINPVFFISIPVIAHLLVTGKIDGRKTRQIQEVEVFETAVTTTIEVSTQPIAIPEAVNQPQPSPTAPTQIQTPPPDSQPIAAAPTYASQPSTQAAAPSYVQARAIGPVERITGSPFQNRLIFGGQRTGKSFLAAIATRQLAATIGLRVFHLNFSHTLTSEGRDEDQEYWEHAAESIRCDLGAMDADEASVFIDSAIAMVDRFWRNPATIGAILVIDEAPSLASRSNAHKALLEPLKMKIASFSSETNSTGGKRSKSVWAIGPEFVSGNMTQEGKSFCKTGKLVHVFIHPKSVSQWNGQTLSFDSGLHQQLIANFNTAVEEPNTAPNCTRGVQIDGRFTNLDGLELESWSGAKCQANETVTIGGWSGPLPTHPTATITAIAQSAPIESSGDRLTEADYTRMLTAYSLTVFSAPPEQQEALLENVKRGMAALQKHDYDGFRFALKG